MQLKSLSNIAEKLKKENVLLTLSVLFITCVFTPYLYWGEDIYMPVFDNLEANLSWIKMILDAGVILPPNATIDQVMNGIPLAAVYGVYDVNLLLFYFFGIFAGYAISKFLVALIGFFGMYLLLKRFIVSDMPLYIPTMVALLFSLLPFWSFTASIAGLPFVFFAFLNFRRGDKHFTNWLILIGYAFYSSLVLTGVFALLVLSALFVYDIYKNKKINSLYFSGLICLTIFYIISHLPLFVTNLDPHYVSARVEFSAVVLFPLREALIYSVKLFVDGDYIFDTKHVLSMQRYLLIPIIIVLFLMIKNKKTNYIYVCVFIYIIITCLPYSLYETRIMDPYRSSIMNILPINIVRFYWLHPICWYVLFAMSCKFIYQNYGLGKYVILVIFSIQIVYVVKSQDHFEYKDKTVSYANFFAEDQFRDIKVYIGDKPENYRTISIGMHPAIAQYNGIYTLDGYIINYSLEYKHQFRKIIAGELNRSRSRLDNFDKWGGRCYAWSSEIVDEANYTTTEFPEIQHLDFDYNQLKLMGGQYIISNAKINTEINTSLKFLKNFKQSDYEHSHWNIYLYKVL